MTTNIGSNMKFFLWIFFFLFASSNIIIAQILTDQDIQEIYDTFVKPNMNEEYQQRYVPLPLAKNNTKWKWEGKDVPRVISLLEFERFVKEHNFSVKKGLAINGVDPEWSYLAAQKIVHINYLNNPNLYDLHTLDLPEKDFDFIMLNQTIEHLYDPIKCLKNIYQHICKGGILYFNAPGDTMPHDTPFHYYNGFTAVGIGALVKAAGFTILRIGQWGNLEYIQKMYQTNRWPDYRELKTPGLNQISITPAIVWIFATK